MGPGGRRPDGREHIQFSEGTRISLHRVIPEDLAGRLLVVDPDGQRTSLSAFAASNRGELTGVLELDPDSAPELDALLTRRRPLKRKS